MKTRNEIEARIAELDAEIQKCEAIQDENHNAYNAVERRLSGDLLDYMKEAGFPVNEKTRMDVRFYGFTSPENKKVSACFVSDDRTEFTVDFRDGKVIEVSASGISSRGGADDFAKITSYYKMVAEVMENITSKYFDTNMCLFFETLAAFEYPEMKQIPADFHEMKEEKRALEKELKVLDLDLEVGRIVEVYIEGTSRRFRSTWREMTVVKMTEKTITLESRAFGSKVIKREDVLDRIRKPKTQEVA